MTIFTPARGLSAGAGGRLAAGRQKRGIGLAEAASFAKRSRQAAGGVSVVLIDRRFWFHADDVFRSPSGGVNLIEQLQEIIMRDRFLKPFKLSPVRHRGQRAETLGIARLAAENEQSAGRKNEAGDHPGISS